MTTTKQLLQRLLPTLFLFFLGNTLSAQNPCGFQVNAGEDVSIDAGNSIQLQGVFNIPENQITGVLWSPPIGLDCSECYSPTTSVEDDICYVFSVTDTSNCTVSDTICVFITPTNTDKQTFDKSLNIYPNPVDDFLLIELDEYRPSTIEIYNAAGQLMERFSERNGNRSSIPTHQLPNGIYFLKLNVGEEVKIGKFIKTNRI